MNPTLKKSLYVVPLVLILLNLPFDEYQLNNACKSFDSYLNIFFSSNCYYNPDNNKDAIEIIKRHTGIGESHEITTEDGYILTAFRIPVEKPKGVVLLQHGLGHDSRFFLAQNNQSVAFVFWRAGYDVWLINSRGTTYSRRHTNITDRNKKFWDFSFHEVGYYELDAAVDYIKNVTKTKKVAYLGLSLGGAVGLVYASVKPQKSADSVKIIINVGPFCFTTVSESIVNYLFLGFSQALLYCHIDDIFQWYELLDHNSWFLAFFRSFNRLFPFKNIIVYGMMMAFGWSPGEFDPNFLNLMIDQMGSSSSLKNFAHLYQLTKSDGRFQMYDHGLEENMKRYGMAEPPKYPLDDIKVPVLNFYGDKDAVVPPQDVEKLDSMIPQRVKLFEKVKVEGFGHHDLVFGIHRNERIYERIIQILDQLKD